MANVGGGREERLRALIREELAIVQEAERSLNEAKPKGRGGKAKKPDAADVEELGRLLNNYIAAASTDLEPKVKAVLKRLGATPEQADRFIEAADALERTYSEASNSPALHNQDDWDEEAPKLEAVLAELGVDATLGDFSVYFPVEQWEEGLEDDEDDEGDDTGEDESQLERDANVDRFSELVASTGYKTAAPYTWGRDEGTGGEYEPGSVAFDAAIPDGHGGWLVGLDRDGNVVMHTMDDDIDMSLDDLEQLLSAHKLDDLLDDDLLDMSTDEINSIIGIPGDIDD
jgi:hypothetical protein